MEQRDYLEQETTESECQGFVINDDAKAEWAMRKIAEARSDTQKWEEHFKRQLEKIAATNESTEAFFTAKLAEFFNRAPKKETKTQAKYSLPSGELIRKQQHPEFKTNEDALVKWLESSGLDAFIKREPKPMWGELKKQCTAQADGSVVDNETGEIVQGVTAIPRPDKFEVRLNETDV